MQTDQDPTPYVVATYEEIRIRFRLGGADQARIKAKRRGWEAEPPNHPGAITRIRVPRAAWDSSEDSDRSRGSDQTRSPRIDQQRPPGSDQKHRANKDLNGVAAVFREELDRQRSERDATVRQLEARLEDERSRAATEATELKATAAELRAETVKLRTDGEAARLEAVRAQAIAEGLRMALEEARRPFWRRWVG